MIGIIKQEYSYGKLEMPDSAGEVATAKRAIRSMLEERPRPTQARIAAATGLTQSRVAKINKCDFERMSDGVRKVVEYSRMSPAARSKAEARSARVASRISVGAERLAAADPALGDAVAEFLECVVKRAGKHP